MTALEQTTREVEEAHKAVVEELQSRQGKSKEEEREEKHESDESDPEVGTEGWGLYIAAGVGLVGAVIGGVLFMRENRRKRR